MTLVGKLTFFYFGWDVQNWKMKKLFVLRRDKLMTALNWLTCDDNKSLIVCQRKTTDIKSRLLL